AFRQRKGGFVDELAHDSPDNEAGRVADPFDVLSKRAEEQLRAPGRGVARVRRASQLDDMRLGDRRERMKANRTAKLVELGETAIRKQDAAGHLAFGFEAGVREPPD